MTVEEQPVTSENTPRPFIEIPKLWFQLNQMSESFFAKEISHASATNTFFGVLTYTAISTTISVFLSLLRSITNSFTNSSATQVASLGTTVLFLCCLGIIITPISFYLNNGITYASALIFGGKGKFVSQTYLGSLFFVPIGLISSLLSFVTLIPKIGDYISYVFLLGIVIFNIFFTVRSFKVVHSFTTARAVAAVVLPLLLLLIPIGIIGILMAMGPVIGNVFSAINSSLSTPMP
jgi:hypothetical protein